MYFSNLHRVSDKILMSTKKEIKVKDTKNIDNQLDATVTGY